jgi:hypothetical protein
LVSITVRGRYVPWRTVGSSVFPYCDCNTTIKENNMNIIITLIIYLVVFGLIWWLVSMLPLPAPVAQIVRVLFIILLILIVLSVFGIIPGGYLPRLNI